MSYRLRQSDDHQDLQCSRAYRVFETDAPSFMTEGLREGILDGWTKNKRDIVFRAREKEMEKANEAYDRRDRK